MISRYEAYMNDVALSSLDSSIYIHDISYAPPAVQFNTFATAKKDGARIHRKYTASSSVVISFEIHKYGIADRQEVCDKVVKWARNGGYLKTSDRTGLRLGCVCSKLPVITSVQKWTDLIEVEFTAYVQPYWEESSYAQSGNASRSTSGSWTFNISGTIDGALLDVVVSPPTGTTPISSFSITVNGETMTLSNLSIPAQSGINITHDENGILSIKSGTTSLLDKRTGIDDLVSVCGDNVISFSADVSVYVTIKTRGLFA